MKALPPIPPAPEWDFRGVHPSALAMATSWEYARTCPVRRVAILKFLQTRIAGQTVKQHLRAEAEKFNGEEISGCLIDQVPEAVRSGITALGMPPRNVPLDLWGVIVEARPDFPQPWTNADCFCQYFPDNRLVIQPLAEHLKRMEGLPMAAIALKDFRFHLNWHDATQKEIVASFAKWLRTEAKRHPEMKARGKPGQVAHEPLKWLSAYRLRSAGFSYEQAQTMLGGYTGTNIPAARLPAIASITPLRKREFPNSKILPLYKDADGWTDAITKATKIIGDIEANPNQL